MLVAEYRYNGLGYRTGVHEDTDTDSDVDGSDLWYYSAYDERWRMVATYRSSDTAPKERFVHQQAGDGGFGGSSYIDLVAFREKDANTAWTSASDGTLEERLYYCQNQHADVVALITAAGGQREMDRYSAYGVPFGLPEGDSNSDGLADGTDRTIIQGWINTSAYDVRGDVDLDGDVDSTDKSAVQALGAVTLGRDALSATAVSNIRGVAGYICSGLESSTYQVRARVFDGMRGSWIARDGVEYSDGMNLYQYVISAPQTNVDSDGTVAVRLGDPPSPPTAGGVPTTLSLVDGVPCVYECLYNCSQTFRDAVDKNKAAGWHWTVELCSSPSGSYYGETRTKVKSKTAKTRLNVGMKGKEGYNVARTMAHEYGHVTGHANGTPMGHGGGPGTADGWAAIVMAECGGTFYTDPCSPPCPPLPSTSIPCP